MDLRELEYFREVCRTGNFTRAATNLHVAQPCITSAVHKLESEFGVQLFLRTTKSVSVTKEGTFFLDRVEKLLSLTAEITQEMLDFNKLYRGSLKLGIPPQIGANLFPSFYTEFTTLYPKLNLSVLEEGSPAILHLIEKGEVDAGIMILPATLPNLNVHVIRYEPVVVCLSQQHPLSKQSIIDFNDLSDEKFILRKANSFHRELVLNECRKRNFTPNIVFTSDQIQTIKSLVANNVGIAFFMKMVVDDHPNIVPLYLADPLGVTIGLVWRKGKYISKATKAFIDFVINKTKLSSTPHNRMASN